APPTTPTHCHLLRVDARLPVDRSAQSRPRILRRATRPLRVGPPTTHESQGPRLLHCADRPGVAAHLHRPTRSTRVTRALLGRRHRGYHHRQPAGRFRPRLPANPWLPPSSPPRPP